jgi:hypothetical protein
VGIGSHTEIDTVGLARWGSEASILGDDLAVSLNRSGQQMALCSNGFGELAKVAFGQFVTVLDGRKVSLLGAMDGLASGLMNASGCYETVDENSSRTMTVSSPARLRL